MQKSCVRKALCYGAECWALKKEDERKLQTTEMRVLCMICGKTLRDGMSNEAIYNTTGMKKIEDS